ncbi:MAG: septum formation initiator family protein [Clostridiales bacterium]|nr:septum formation initiator family protein [Clostridiales bacterium]
METAQTKNKKSFCWSRLAFICVLFFLTFWLGHQYQRYQAIQAEVEIYRQKLEEAQEEYRRAQRQVKLYYSDSYLEQLARSSLGMVKVGEVVISPAEISDVRELNENTRLNNVLH